jgi:hypothetical protein
MNLMSCYRSRFRVGAGVRKEGSGGLGLDVVDEELAKP